MDASLLDRLSDPNAWESFYEYKTGLISQKSFSSELRSFIDEKRYLPVCDLMLSGKQFPLPRKSVISKMGKKKKRTVYIYPEECSIVLKLLTHLMIRKYDGIFSGHLYSFRPNLTAKDAVYRFCRNGNISSLYAYKADIHDYFNSIPVGRFLPLLKEALSDDPRLYAFLSSLLEETRVLERGKTVIEQKGIMAGTPQSAFYANLYLSGLDREIADRSRLYARYSDDIIVFTETEEECLQCAEIVRKSLENRSLAVNPSKESFFRPGDGIDFLGFRIEGKTVDISPASVLKIKQKMRRKRDALQRWRLRNGEDGVRAAKAFLRVFNSKLFGAGTDGEIDDHDLTWSEWYFPLITTEKSLHEIDAYAQDCIRYLISGTHTKARFNVRYPDLKRIGYRSLVNAYYSYRKQHT